jgi:hypothetical protein
VLYLELFRVSLRELGTTILGVRFLSAAAGALSLLTAVLLGRALLPGGGGAGFLFSHSAAAFAASFMWGQAGHPNGYRFAYLTTVTAVAASAGTLLVISFAFDRTLTLLQYSQSVYSRLRARSV